MAGSSDDRRRIDACLTDKPGDAIDGRGDRRHRDQVVDDAVEDERMRLRRAARFERILASNEDVGIPEWGTRESASDWVNGLRREWDRALPPGPDRK